MTAISVSKLSSTAESPTSEHNLDLNRKRKSALFPHNTRTPSSSENKENTATNQSKMLNVSSPVTVASATDVATTQINVKDRRRSYSGFTFHFNNSFDFNQQQSQPLINHKRSSLSAVKRRSLSTNNNVSTPSLSLTIPKSISFSSKSKTPLSSSSANSNSNYLFSNTPLSSRPKSSSTRFFSSPQFSSSTPNLPHNSVSTKTIAKELRISHESVEINNVSLTIPSIVCKTCAYIKSNEKIEGLFRMNGSIKQVNMIEFNLSKNLAYDFDSELDTSLHDIALVLKRWISKIEDGLVPSDICNSLIQVQRDLMVHDILSEEEEGDEESIIDMNQNIMPSPTKSLHDLSLKSTERDYSSIVAPPPRITSTYSHILKKLPIESLHLILYLLLFLKDLTKPEVTKITKMNVSNLAKVFQLNFFKSVDLTVGTKSFSTEDLKSSYMINEELLIGLINDSELILKDLKVHLKENEAQLLSLINAETCDHNPLNDGTITAGVSTVDCLNGLNNDIDDDVVIGKRDSTKRRSVFGFFNKRRSTIENDTGDNNLTNEAMSTDTSFNKNTASIDTSISLRKKDSKTSILSSRDGSTIESVNEEESFEKHKTLDSHSEDDEIVFNSMNDDDDDENDIKSVTSDEIRSRLKSINLSVNNVVSHTNNNEDTLKLNEKKDTIMTNKTDSDDAYIRPPIFTAAPEKVPIFDDVSSTQPMKIVTEKPLKKLDNDTSKNKKKFSLFKFKRR